jgi:hypothetical protein
MDNQKELRFRELLEKVAGRVWDLGFGKFAGALISRGYITPGGDIIKGIKCQK